MVFEHIQRSETKDWSTLKDLTVRRGLKDNKVPGTSAGTRAAEAPARAQGLLQHSWEGARLGCVSSQVFVWTRGA